MILDRINKLIIVNNKNKLIPLRGCVIIGVFVKKIQKP